MKNFNFNKKAGVRIALNISFFIAFFALLSFTLPVFNSYAQPEEDCSPLTIDQFSADPNPAASGEEVTITWEISHNGGSTFCVARITGLDGLGTEENFSTAPNPDGVVRSFYEDTTISMGIYDSLNNLHAIEYLTIVIGESDQTSDIAYISVDADSCLSASWGIDPGGFEGTGSFVRLEVLSEIGGTAYTLGVSSPTSGVTITSSDNGSSTSGSLTMTLFPEEPPQDKTFYIDCTPPPSTTGTLTPAVSSCTIPSGQSSCNINFSWDTVNPVAGVTSKITSSYPVDNTQIATGNSGGPTAFTIPFLSSPRTFYLYHNGEPPLASSTVSASCAPDTSWSSAGSICHESARISVTSNVGGGWTINPGDEINGVGMSGSHTVFPNLDTGGSDGTTYTITPDSIPGYSYPPAITNSKDGDASLSLVNFEDESFTLTYTSLSPVIKIYTPTVQESYITTVNGWFGWHVNDGSGSTVSLTRVFGGYSGGVGEALSSNVPAGTYNVLPDNTAYYTSGGQTATLCNSSGSCSGVSTPTALANGDVLTVSINFGITGSNPPPDDRCDPPNTWVGDSYGGTCESPEGEPGVNLTAGSISPTSATVNTSTSYSAVISNNGGDPVSGSITHLFQYDEDADHNAVTSSSTTITENPIVAGGNISAYNSKTFTSTGTKYIRVCADNNASFVGTVAESNEADNCSSPWTTVTVSAALPDITASSSSPNTAIVNTAVDLSAIVRNIGSASTTGPYFYNRFQVATLPNGGGTISDLGIRAMGTLTAGASEEFTTSHTFTSQSTYSVLACADTFAQVSESNESNNCGSWTSVYVNPPGGTCSDGIKNGNETGIDTGGRCVTGGTCSDGIKNGNETDIDTGGRCGDGNCFDGIKNGNETGIDTGGRCVPGDGHCFDGIQNGNETGIDIGGRCGSGVGDCFDMEMNGNETGIDIGGRCGTRRIPAYQEN